MYSEAVRTILVRDAMSQVYGPFCLTSPIPPTTLTTMTTLLFSDKRNFKVDKLHNVFISHSNISQK